jgi:intein/homing endonuclease
VVEENKYFKSSQIFYMFQIGQPVSVLKEDGTVHKIIDIKTEEKEVPVYNLEIEGATLFTDETGHYGVGHNYFANGVLAHNALHFLQPWIPVGLILFPSSANAAKF